MNFYNIYFFLFAISNAEKSVQNLCVALYTDSESYYINYILWTIQTKRKESSVYDMKFRN